MSENKPVEPVEPSEAIDIESGDTEVHIDTGYAWTDILAFFIVAVLVGMVIYGVYFI